MTQKIRMQASRFWNTIASAETLNTYKSAIDATINILKEGILLIWLVLCLVLVIFDWGTVRAIAAGNSTRDWVEDLKKTDSSQFGTSAKEKFLSASKASVNATIAQARQQLGLPVKPPTLELPASSQPEATPKKSANTP